MSHYSIDTESLPRPGGARSHMTSMDGLVVTAGFAPHDPETVRATVGPELLGILVDVVARTLRQ